MAFATLTVDMQASLAKFEQDLKKAVDESKHASHQIKESFESVKGALEFVGISLAIHEIVQQFNEVIDSITNIGRASEKTGVAVDALIGLKLAAASVKLPFDELVAGLVKFDKALDKEVPALQQLGFSLKQIEDFAKDPKKALDDIADKFANMEKSGTKTALMLQIFGRGGSALAAFLNLGSKGFEEYAEKAKLLGLAFSPEELEKTKKFEEEMVLLAAAFEGAKQQLVIGMIPALTQVAVAFNEAAQKGSVLIGVLAGFAQFSKVTMFGADKTEIQKQIKDIDIAKERLEELSKALDHLQSSPAFANRLAETKRQIAELKVFIPEATAALERMQGKTPESEQKKPAPAKLTDPTKGAAENKARLHNLFALEKENADEVLQVLEDLHARGLISEKSFYENRTQIARRELGNQLAAVQAAIADIDKSLKGADRAKIDAANVQRIALLGQAAVLQKKIDNEGDKGLIERAVKEDALGDKIKEIHAQQLEDEGNLTAATKARLEIQERVLRAQLTSSGKVGALAELERNKALLLTKSALSEVQKEQNTLLQEEANAEAKIANQLASSGNSPEAQLTALRQINEVRQASLGPLRASVEEALQYAQTLGGPAGKEAVAQMQALKIRLDALAASSSGAAAAAAEFQLAQQKTAGALEEESIAEAHLQNLRTSGAATSLGTMQKIDELRRGSIALLEREADAQQKLADATNDPSAARAVRRLRTEIEALEASSHQVADTFNKVFADAFSSPFTDFITGAKSAKEAFADFGKQVEQSLARIATQQLAEQIFGGGGKGGGIGGIIAGLFGAYAGSGGGGGGSIQYAGQGAVGGAFTVGGSGGVDSKLVAFHATPGERVTLTPSGGRRSGGGVNVGGVVVNINNARDAEDIRRSGSQIAKDVGRKINRELARS